MKGRWFRFRIAARFNEITWRVFGVGQTHLNYRLTHDKEGRYRVRETAMGVIGAVYQPEIIELMKAVLDDAAATLPEAKRTSTMKAEIASHILACAAKGERDPAVLKVAALSAVTECSHYSHHISAARRAV